jgi:hypothetical protein
MKVYVVVANIVIMLGQFTLFAEQKPCAWILWRNTGFGRPDLWEPINTVETMAQCRELMKKYGKSLGEVEIKESRGFVSDPTGRLIQIVLCLPDTINPR